MLEGKPPDREGSRERPRALREGSWRPPPAGRTGFTLPPPNTRTVAFDDVLTKLLQSSDVHLQDENVTLSSGIKAFIPWLLCLFKKCSLQVTPSGHSGTPSTR